MNDVDECIRHKIGWAQLPTQIKQLLGNSQKEYQRYIFEFSIRNQLRYRGNLVRTIRKDERRYYEVLVQSSKQRLMLFPYHLADMVVKGLRITPFSYYKEVVGQIMDMEKSYDTLPNFTAADCLRLLGIGRNEYIELMNRARGRGRMRRSPGCRLLPALPCPPPLQPWWRLELGYVLEDDVRSLYDEERSLIDMLIDQGSQTLGTLDHNIVQSLYKKGLVYVDVPITGVDRVRVPPLQGFVMNRVMGDYFETLLYKIFVSIDENTTVSELSSVLQVDVELVKQAVSLYCRLGFAQKLDVPPINNMHPSWVNLTPVKIVRPVTPLTFDQVSHDTSSSLEMEPVLTNLPETPLKEERPIFPGVYKDTNTDDRKGPRFAFLFDSTLTAYLMMGNLSPDLKNHAVTMFEVGKLCDESINSFLDELDKIAWQDIEGEAKRYWTHALVLRSALRALSPLRPLDLVRCESLQSLDTATAARLLNNKYKLLVSMAPLSREVRPPQGAPSTPPFLGPVPPETNSLWFKLYIYHVSGYGPPTLLLTKGTVLKNLPRLFLGFSRLLVASWQHEAVVLATCNFLAINATLKYSPVMIQAYGVRDVASTKLVTFPPTADISEKDENDTPWWDHAALKRLASRIDLQHTCGYITMVDIAVPDWGIDTVPSQVILGKGPTSSVRRKSKLIKSLSSQMSFDESIIGTQNVFEKIDESNLRVEQKESKSSLSEDGINEDTLRKEISEKLNLESDKSKDHRLQSPNESHFATTPIAQSKTHSPANGFTSVECSSILCQELDQLEKLDLNDDNSSRPIDKTKHLDCDKDNPEFYKPDITKLRLESIDNLMSPIDENISMFSQLNKESEPESLLNELKNAESSSREEESTPVFEEQSEKREPKAEQWTLLECHFGIPLFDEDANQKICNAIVNKLSHQESLEKLKESNKALSTDLLAFISQCQYFPGEDMGIIKRGQLVPLPKKNLSFENGKISLWGGK